MLVDFDCRKCGEPFDVKDWTFSDDVQCPHCGQWFETDYDEDWEGSMTGPWLHKEIPPPCNT